MSNKIKLRVYEPPQAIDLSVFSATGIDPKGRCAGGAYPYFACETGGAFYSSCAPGTGVDTSSCAPGGIHTYPACQPGGFATTGCLSGSHQNF